MNQQKQIKNLRQLAMLLSDAADSAEDLVDHNRMIAGFQKTCKKAITERDNIRRYADGLEKALDVAKNPHCQLCKESDEARRVARGLEATLVDSLSEEKGKP